MKSIFKSLLIITFTTWGLLSFGQIQVITGIEHGTYFKLAKDMNKYLPKVAIEVDGEMQEKDFLDARATPGSSFNFELIADPKHPAKAAMLQLDVLLLKKAEDMLNETKMTEDIVILMPLITEDIHLVSRKGSPIHHLKDLEGKTVGIGSKEEGTYSTAMYIQNTSKIPWNNRNISTQECMKALLLEKIDAFFMVAGAPVQLFEAMPVTSPLKLQLSNVENMNGWADYYLPYTIPSNMYHWLENNIETYSVPSVIVVNTKKLSDKELAQLKEWRSNTLENLDNLKAYGHKSWNTVQSKEWNNSIWPILE